MNKSSIYVHDEITHNFKAAEEILPMLFEVYKPVSVLDLGCGLGTWLKVAKDLGVKDILGVDGSYVDRSMLKIKETEFLEFDISNPISLGRRLDLVICLEVAEHLPESSADSLIKSLVKHADVILFSAAIPGQGGQNHLNEQWPAYWQDIFQQHNFMFVDYFRPKIWNNENIEFWYRQNIFLVVNKDHALGSKATSAIMPMVHPELFRSVLMQKDDKIARLKQKLKDIEQGSGLKRIVKQVFKKK